MTQLGAIRLVRFLFKLQSARDARSHMSVSGRAGIKPSGVHLGGGVKARQLARRSWWMSFWPGLLGGLLCLPRPLVSKVEPFLTDCPNVIDAGREQINAVLSKLANGAEELGANAGTFLCPKAFGFLDCLHMVFGVLCDVCSRSDGWQEFESQFRAGANFLADRDLRGRFVVSCLSNALVVERVKFATWAHQRLDWRWEFLEDVLQSFVPS